MKLLKTTITFRDSCKTYALKRIGLSNLINWENDTPKAKDLWNSDMFQKIEEPETGCVLIWKHKNSEDYYQSHQIEEDGRIVQIKRNDYGHAGIYENNNMVSDCTDGENGDRYLRLRNYADLPKPDFILKLKDQ